MYSILFLSLFFSLVARFGCLRVKMWCDISCTLSLPPSPVVRLSSMRINRRWAHVRLFDSLACTRNRFVSMLPPTKDYAVKMQTVKMSEWKHRDGKAQEKNKKKVTAKDRRMNCVRQWFKLFFSSLSTQEYSFEIHCQTDDEFLHE